MILAGNRLKTGDPAPLLDAETLDGAAMRVPDDSWTLLSFLRYASCPMCNLRVRELMLATSELEGRGITWVAVFHSPRERLVRHFDAAAQRHIVADPRRLLYATYGIEQSWRGLFVSMFIPSFYTRFVRASVLGYWGGAIDASFRSMPADFLVSPDGVIRQLHYGKHLGDHLPLSALGVDPD
jgi:peroxiredoxin